jgi:hypothetical protein
MDVYVLNSSHEPIAVIDAFKSLIWTRRYYNCGDFELYIPANDSLLPYLQPDYFLIRDNDDSVMVIEKLELQTDAENGDFFIVSGRSLESILLRRIFNRQYALSTTSVNGAVWAMIQECTTVHPPNTGTYRQIQGLGVNFNPDYMIEGNVQAQFTGQTLLDAIISICQPREVGFKMTFSGTNLLLTLYKGGEANVIFSPEFDNLINSKYIFDKSNLANQVYVAGEGQGSARKWASVIKGTFANRPSGLALRELYVDARDISSNDGEISSPDYYNMLSSRGNEKLAEHSVTQTFEAEVEPQTTYQYKRDYNLGDVVTVKNEYGVTAKPRIVEIIESWDDTGYSVIPTFDALDVVNHTVLKDSEGNILKDSTGSIIEVEG